MVQLTPLLPPYAIDIWGGDSQNSKYIFKMQKESDLDYVSIKD